MPLVKQVRKCGKLVAVLAASVHIVHYGNETDTVFRIDDLLIPPDADMFTPETA